MIRIYLVSIFIGFAVAQDCPNVPVKPNFDLPKIVGTWYKIKQFGGIKPVGRCITYNFSVHPSNYVYASLTQIPIVTNQESVRAGFVAQIEEEKAKLTVFDKMGIIDHFMFVDTDYESFAVTWHCENGTQRAGLIAKEQHPPQSVLEKLYAVSDRLGINRTELITVDQENCNNQ